MSIVRALIFLLSSLLLGYLVEERLMWMLVPYPHSTDGFYYLKEISSRLSGGHGYYTTFSPYFTLVAGLGKLLGMHEGLLYPLIIFLTASLFSCALVLPLLSRELFHLCPLAAMIPWISDLLFFRIYAFPRQALSMAIFSAAALLVTRRTSVSQLWRWLLIAAATCMHVLGAALGALLLLADAKASNSRKIAVILALGGCAAVLVYSIVSGEKEIFRTENPSMLPSWVGDCHQVGCSALEFAEFISGFVLALVLATTLLFCSSCQERKKALLLCACYFIFVLPIWDNEGLLSARLSYSALVPLVAAGLLAFPRYFPIYSLLLLGMSLIFSAGSYSAKELPVKPIIQNQKLLKQWIGPNDLIRADHGIQFVASYLLDRKAVKRYPAKGPYFELMRRSSRRPECIPAQSSVDFTLARCLDLGNRWIIIHRNSK